MSGSKAMNLEKAEFSNEGKVATSTASSCSICLELVLNQGDRSTARLQCGHEFHLGDELFTFVASRMFAQSYPLLWLF